MCAGWLPGGDAVARQLHWLATALKSFEAINVLPVFQLWGSAPVVVAADSASVQGFFIGGSVIGGGVYFNEFVNFGGMWCAAL